MQIYHYDPETGLPLGTSQADESPLEPGKYLIPAHATKTPLPPMEFGKRVRWDGENWLVEPAPVPPPPSVPEPETQEQTISRLKAAVQRHLNITAQADDWDDIRSASLRAGYPGPFQARGLAYALWMDVCWQHCYRVLADVQAGIRPIPSEDELIAELPALVLP